MATMICYLFLFLLWTHWIIFQGKKSQDFGVLSSQRRDCLTWSVCRFHIQLHAKVWHMTDHAKSECHCRWTNSILWLPLYLVDLNLQNQWAAIASSYFGWFLYEHLQCSLYDVAFGPHWINDSAESWTGHLQSYPPVVWRGCVAHAMLGCVCEAYSWVLQDTVHKQGMLHFYSLLIFQYIYIYICGAALVATGNTYWI